MVTVETMTSWAIGLLLLSVVLFIICVLLLRKIKIRDDEIWEKKSVIFRLNMIIDRLMPEHPCMSMIPSKPKIKCMKPATHIYAGLEICEECAQKRIENGANPPPVRFDFEKQRAIVEQIQN